MPGSKFKMAAKNLQNLVSKVRQIPQNPQTGIPIIIRPFVVKKAFVVHPKVTAFQADLKAQWLTKTCLRKGLPDISCEAGSEITDVQVNYVRDSIEKSLLQTLVAQKTGRRWKMRYNNDIIDSFFPNFLNPCWSLAEHIKNGVLDYRPTIATHWSRNHNFYQTRFDVGYVLRMEKPLPNYETDISTTANVDLPGPYNPVDLKIFNHPTIKLPNNPGYLKHTKTTYPHTMLIPDFMSRNQEHMIHHGIQAMFTQLVAMAMDQGYYLGEHLKLPLSTKCVVTNGRVYLFMAYQLNTLSLQEDFGIKNIAWYEDFETMYDADSNPFKKGNNTFYEGLPRDTKTLEVNEQCLRTFMSFLVQKTQF